MLKTALVTGALILTAGCSQAVKSTPLPEDATIRTLVSKLEPAMQCGTPQDSQTDRSVRADCDNGDVFVEAWPDAASVRAELARIAGQGIPQDYLVGDDGTWFAGAGLPDGLDRLRTYLGGRIQHVGPAPTG